MMKRLSLLVCVVCFLLLAPIAGAQDGEGSSQEPVVQAILFYSPTCPHCHEVIENDLPPLQKKYGAQLQILGVNTTEPGGQRLYENMVAYFEVPREKLGVPALVVGDQLMVGSYEIPQRFPQIIEAGLAAEGIGWPDIPDLKQMVSDLPPSTGPAVVPEMSAAAASSAEEPATVAPTPVAEEVAPVGEAAEETEEEPAEAAPLGETEPESEPALPAIDMAAATEETPPADPAGFALAWVIMAGMVFALIFVAWRFMAARPYLLERLENPPSLSPWIVPLVILGLAVAAYLAYVEVTQTRAVCGPVGECNIVQASSYARIGGIPIAVLGLFNYLAVGALWLWQRSGRSSEGAIYALLALTVFGTFFSIYLTALELFVIGAVCIWCLTSAVVTTLLMVVVVHDLTKRPSQGEAPLEFAGG